MRFDRKWIFPTLGNNHLAMQHGYMGDFGFVLSRNL